MSNEELTENNKQIRNLPPMLSFFTGAGFLDLGIVQAGFRIPWSLELNPDFCYAHDYGMNSHFNIVGAKQNLTSRSSCYDIQRKSPSDIMKEAFGTMSRGDYFGVLGGPPCPDFSVGGRNLGYEAERGRLIQVFIERICEMQPTFFLIENVKGLIKTRKHREFLFDQIRKLEEKEYAVDIAVINALDLGVPQDRERVFVIGIKNALIKNKYMRSLKQGERGWFPWPQDDRYDKAKTRFCWPTVNPFNTEPIRPKGIPRELFVEQLLMNQSEIERLPNGKDGFRPHSEKFSQIQEGDVSRKSFKRLHRFRYSPTEAYGNNEVHLHPVFPRRLRVREALRIQTVPDSFALPPELSLTMKFRLTGNGVPVRLAYCIGLALGKFLIGAINLNNEH